MLNLKNNELKTISGGCVPCETITSDVPDMMSPSIKIMYEILYKRKAEWYPCYMDISLS